MKKWLLILFAVLLVLTACDAEGSGGKNDGVKQDSTNKSQEDIDKDSVNEEAPDEVDKETSQSITEEDLKEIFSEYGMGEGDTLVSASLKGGEIKAVIELEPDDLFEPRDLAITRYSQASDELLSYEGWEVLTIEYVDAGTISMNRSEKESNEYGDYFPTIKIEKRLK